MNVHTMVKVLLNVAQCMKCIFSALHIFLFLSFTLLGHMFLFSVSLQPFSKLLGKSFSEIRSCSSIV